MNISSLELRLIADDVYELLKLFRSVYQSGSGGYLALAISPCIGLVIQESHKYLSERNHLSDDHQEVIAKYQLPIAKLRALLKLFDDTDGGQQGLVETLEAYRQKSAELMDVGKSTLQRLVARYVQPDVGLYFLDEYLIYPSTVGFSAIGLTRQQVSSLSDQDLQSVGTQSHEFGNYVASYLFDVLRVSGAIQRMPQLSIEVASVDVEITHNDFRSSLLYRGIKRSEMLVGKLDAGAILYIASLVNLGLHLLPKILPASSGVLLRMQFLIAHHACAALSRIPTASQAGLLAAVRDLGELPRIQNERRLRNCMAHYGFGEARRFIVNSDSPLDQIIVGLSGKSRQDIIQVTVDRLNIISRWSMKNMSKRSLRPYQAMFGSHS